jgi:hypothetical protein
MIVRDGYTGIQDPHQLGDVFLNGLRRIGILRLGRRSVDATLEHDRGILYTEFTIRGCPRVFSKG